MLEISEPLTSAPSHLYVLDISILEWGGEIEKIKAKGILLEVWLTNSETLTFISISVNRKRMEIAPT